MSRVRMIFLGTADFAVPSLEAAIQDEHYEVVQVVTQPDRPAGRKLELKASPVKECALKHGIPIYAPESIKTKDSLEYIRSLKADVAVVIAYGQILTEDFLNSFPYGAVNVHGSLLPRWRGAAPIQRAIMEGDKETGVCIQKMVQKLDAGDVLGQRKMEISENMDTPELYEKLKKLATELIHIDLMDYIRGNLSGVKQEEDLVTIAQKIKKEEGQIDWSKTSEEIWNTYKALKMWPGVWTVWKGKKIKIHSMKKLDASGKPGQVLESGKDTLIVACGEGALEILVLQPESKAKMSVADFINGFGKPEQFT